MIISKYVIHVLDKEGLILNEHEGSFNLDLEKLFINQIKKIVKSDFIRKAKFNNAETNIVKNCCENILTIEKSKTAFLENSKVIASHLYKQMKEANNFESCDLLVAHFMERDQQYVAILKLDYKTLHNHKIELIDEKFNVQMVQNEIAINSTSCVTQAAIIGINNLLDEEYNLRFYDVEAEKKNSYSNFMLRFLDIKKVKDHKVQTINFEKYVKEWINNYVPDIQVAQEIRDVRDHMLLNNDVLDINKFIDTALTDYNLNESFEDFCCEKEIYEDFNIAKKYIEKKLKKRTIKTDIGFDITGYLDDFHDSMKFKIVKNSNGSYDIVLKNVLYYEEK